MMIFSGFMLSIILKRCICIQEALNYNYAEFQKYPKKIDNSR